MTNKYEIQNIPIKQIRIMNSRERSEKSFQDVKGNISRVGLKKPVTVRPCDDGKGYELVCGEGRLKSLIALGQTTVPAIVRRDLSQEDAFVMSLVENMARRHHSAMDLLKGIEKLKEQGYSVMDISRKTGLGNSYVSGILKLFEMGEERILAAVEKGQIPLTIAMKIASSPGEEQKALQEAYENNDLRGKRFVLAQRLFDKRRTLGKKVAKGRYWRNQEKESVSTMQMVQKFQTEIDRMHSLVEKTEIANNTLLVIVESFFNLLKDENFVTLLRAEQLETMPETLVQMIKDRGNGYG